MDKEKQNGITELKKSEAVPEKKFITRNSLLTDMLDNIPHIRTIRNIFVAILICLGISTVAHDYFIKKEVHFGLTLIYSGFGKFQIVLCSWILLMIFTLLCYTCFAKWAKVRATMPPKSIYLKIWDSAWIVATVGYYIFCFKFSTFIVVTFRLPPPSACVVLLEQVRLLMKVHAFVRTSAEEVLKFKPSSDQKLAMPTFSQYLYFLFAPTCIFRTEYPRTKEIRWRFVIYRALEIYGVIVFHSFIFHRFFLPAYNTFGLRKFTWNEIIVSMLEHALPALLIYISGFYLLLHSFQNMFAELLRFGDRLFYKDWWNFTTFSRFFRSWNIVVHDWLYTYIYKDIYEHAGRNKALAKGATFLISAVIHEWALTYMFGYFFPGLFIFFMVFAVLVSCVDLPDVIAANTLFWVGLAFGSAFLISGYTLEYFARNNTSQGDGSMQDFLLPKWLTCDCID